MLVLSVVPRLIKCRAKLHDLSGYPPTIIRQWASLLPETPIIILWPMPSHPQEAASTFSPHTLLPLHTTQFTRPRPRITSVHLKNICCLLFLCLFPLVSEKKDPVLVLVLGRVPEPLLSLAPWRISSCFLSILAASLWLTFTCFPPPRSISSTLISSELPSHLPPSFPS